WPVIHLGFIYARLRYGVNLWRASPADAVRGTHTPILLIHGANDDNIPPRHSRELHAANPTATELWEVPGAGHVASITTQPEAYQRRVTQWFDTHR
ncbi:MAG TPA: alpha/beta fold hydrolase, partial [Terriglobales bacterium]|nr:alpha/beta fold hydrolase [Terriglobales bacterium]